MGQIGRAEHRRGRMVLLDDEHDAWLRVAATGRVGRAVELVEEDELPHAAHEPAQPRQRSTP